MSFDSGLLGSQIAAFCSGVNDNEDNEDVVFDWPWAISGVSNSVNVNAVLAARMTIVAMRPRDAYFFDISYWREKWRYIKALIRRLPVSILLNSNYKEWSLRYLNDSD